MSRPYEIPMCGIPRHAGVAVPVRGRSGLRRHPYRSSGSCTVDA